MMIPGLDVVCPISEDEQEEISENFVSFSGTSSVSIPKSRIFGACRRINEFENRKVMKVTPAWVYRQCVEIRTKNMVCIKKSMKGTPPDDCKMKDIASLTREIQILTTLKHDNIMNFLDVAVKPALDGVYLVFEHCEWFLSDLLDRKIDTLFDRSVAKHIFKQIIQALEYIHRHLIMHRDIHPKNIMFNEEGILKVANFENARQFSSYDLKLVATSINYHAPELLLSAKRHGPEIDVWAAGCILAKLFLQEDIFCGTTMEMVFTRMINILGIPSDEIYPGYSDLPGVAQLDIRNAHSYNCLPLHFKRHSPQTKSAIELLDDMFIYDPSRRITTEKLLKYEYFKELPQASSNVELANILREHPVIGRMNPITA